jgi:hypothetical protein
MTSGSCGAGTGLLLPQATRKLLNLHFSWLLGIGWIPGLLPVDALVQSLPPCLPLHSPHYARPGHLQASRVTHIQLTMACTTEKRVLCTDTYKPPCPQPTTALPRPPLRPYLVYKEDFSSHVNTHARHSPDRSVHACEGVGAKPISPVSGMLETLSCLSHSTGVQVKKFYTSSRPQHPEVRCPSYTRKTSTLRGDPSWLLLSGSGFLPPQLWPLLPSPQ